MVSYNTMRKNSLTREGVSEYESRVSYQDSVNGGTSDSCVEAISSILLNSLSFGPMIRNTWKHLNTTPITCKARVSNVRLE